MHAIISNRIYYIFILFSAKCLMCFEFFNNTLHSSFVSSPPANKAPGVVVLGGLIGVHSPLFKFIRDFGGSDPLWSPNVLKIFLSKCHHYLAQIWSSMEYRGLSKSDVVWLLKVWLREFCFYCFSITPLKEANCILVFCAYPSAA